MYTPFKRIKLPIFTLCMSFLALSCAKEEATEEVKVAEELSQVNVSVSTLKNPTSIMYVEVNDNEMSNVGAYTLPNGKPFADIAIIFASNINYDAVKKKAVVFLNPQVKSTLKRKASTIRPLQKKGIKVLLAILGNHQGAGLANFTTRAKAKAFAKQVANVVRIHGLDGVDLDDEFSDYGTNRPVAKSFIWFLQELKAAMPNKLITFYNIGPVKNQLTSEGKKAGQFLDFANHPSYGTYDASISVPGLTKRRLGPAAVNIQATPASLAASLAARTKKEGFGAFIIYNLDGANRTSYLNGISQKLYGKPTKLTGNLK